MRYYLRSSSLIVRGKFRACSSGPRGGIRECTTLINHQVPPHFSSDPHREIESVCLALGLSYDKTAGLLTAVDMHTLCILSWENLTVFVTAGVTHPDPKGFGEMVPENSPGTINIIVVTENFHDQALVDAIITVTEAKSLALLDTGHECMGTITDAVLIATEGAGEIRYAGSGTEIGQRMHETVYVGVREALARQIGSHKKPSFFIRSGIGGHHWVLWEKGHCPYYPCHGEGQRCDFCYCPLYPCGDIALGDWVQKSGKKPVWACTRCVLNHHPVVTQHLLRNPEASLLELKSLFSKNPGFLS